MNTLIYDLSISKFFNINICNKTFISTKYYIFLTSNKKVFRTTSPTACWRIIVSWFEIGFPDGGLSIDELVVAVEVAGEVVQEC